MAQTVGKPHVYSLGISKQLNPANHFILSDDETKVNPMVKTRWRI